MAEGPVSFLLEKLTSILSQEITQLGRLRGEVQQIKLELESMRSFVRDADTKQESNRRVKTWVEQVRETAYDVEDIIDEFMHRFDRQPREGFSCFLHDTISLPRDLIAKRRIASRLQQIKRDVQAISERRIRYGLPLIEEGTSSNYVHHIPEHYRDNCLNLEDANIVGSNKKIDSLVGLLTEDDPRRMVISVVGMGGLGKTTLVAKTYKSQTIKKHFDCSAWISVSQCYRIEDLLRSMMQELFMEKNEVLPYDIGNMNTRQLNDKANCYLDSKRYLIVLDDVWSINAWSDISSALPNSRCGSRIVLTTRRIDVASALGDGSRDFPLKPLNKEEAWDLFCKKAFGEEPCPPKLQLLAQNFVDRCDGIPLAIVAIGGLLASKDKCVWAWENVYNSLRWQLSNNDMLKSIHSVLLLSFNDLPYYLKACFLYCSVFREDHSIHRKKLIRLWVAEGFVEEREGMTMEDVAEDYLMQLVHRSMIQLTETNLFGRVRTCRAHDLMRDLALSISREEKFGMLFNGQEETSPDSKIKRLSICKIGECSQSITGMQHLRSFFMFDANVPSSFSFHTIVSRFKLLRVLDLGSVCIESVPGGLTDLFNLRYLNLTGTNVKELPNSLGRLKNLLTLDIRDTKIERLPDGVVKLQKLRHLYLYRRHVKYYESFNFISSIQVPNGICCLKELHTLVHVEANGEMVRQVGHLTQLRSFGIGKLRAFDGEELCNSIKKMENLRNLLVRSTDEDELLALESLSPPPHLQKMYLQGRLEKLPHWFGSIANLTCLSLSWSRLRDDPLCSLQALSNLVLLELIMAYDGQRLSSHAGWFPKLKKLHLDTLTQLNHVKIEKGAMPRIHAITMFCCSELKMVPEGIEHLTSLQELYLKEMPDELLQRLRGDGGEDFLKIQHIPDVRHWYRGDGKWILERFS